MKLKFSPLFIAPIAVGLIAGADPAKAVLNYNIYESLGNVVIETDGSLSALSAPTGNFLCGAAGAFLAGSAGICVGPDLDLPKFALSGPSRFASGSGSIYPASSVSGITAALFGRFGSFIIDSSYVLGTPIISSATFNGKTLADFGLTPSSGLLGTWTLDGTSESINVRVFNPVPGPLPVLGAGAAFGFSRRLRRRINASGFRTQN